MLEISDYVTQSYLIMCFNKKGQEHSIEVINKLNVQMEKFQQNATIENKVCKYHLNFLGYLKDKCISSHAIKKI